MIKICDLDMALYRCVSPDIQTSEVIITEERIEHVKLRHPGNYERFRSYISLMITEPEYIIEANKPNTAVILKEFAENGKKFKLILRLKTADSPGEYKNSVISFWHIGEVTWKKIIKNKKILYKRE